MKRSYLLFYCAPLCITLKLQRARGRRLVLGEGRGSGPAVGELVTEALGLASNATDFGSVQNFVADTDAKRGSIARMHDIAPRCAEICEAKRQQPNDVT
jgi:hypothetical protein